jgi:hypothetical protein
VYALSVVDANEADAQRACTKLGVPTSTRIFNIHVPNDALEFNGYPNLVNGYEERQGSQIPDYFIAAPTYRGRCLGRRFTRTFPIYDKTTNRTLLLKDTWRVDRADFEKEAQVYAALKVWCSGCTFIISGCARLVLCCAKLATCLFGSPHCNIWLGNTKVLQHKFSSLSLAQSMLKALPTSRLKFRCNNTI